MKIDKNRMLDLDVFCHVIDNFGDAGVVYRFAREYKRLCPEVKVRVFTDELEAFSALCPEVNSLLNRQQVKGVELIHFSQIDESFVAKLSIPPLIVEAFACQIPNLYLDKASKEGRFLINLEYLMAEDWVEGFHGFESRLGYEVLRKYFFMPGFTLKTGGLLPNSQLDYDLIKQNREVYRHQFLPAEASKDILLGTVFSYEHNFSNFINSLINLDREVYLIIFGKKSQESFRDLLTKHCVEEVGGACQIGKIKLFMSDFIAQEEYDLLLNVADFNLVRGEDSWARAALSGVPFLWHCYLEKESYHDVKVEAFIQKWSAYSTDLEIRAEVGNLFRDYNRRVVDSYRNDSIEEYDFFWQNLHKIGEININFADFLRNNCNLIEKLLYFVSNLE